MVNGLRNPYIELYHWVKGELYDLYSVVEALRERNYVGSAIRDVKKKISATQADIGKLNDGKKSLTSMFKSKDAGKMQDTIELSETELGY